MEREIEKQMELNGDLNLFFSGLNGAVGLDNGFISGILVYRERRRNVSEALLNGTVRKALASFYDINQYINVQKEDVRALGEVYETTFEKLTEENVNSVMADHHQRLSSWLGRFYPSGYIDLLGNRERIGRVMNREYSAEFQIGILDLELHQLAGPILDIGCGGSGRLVRRLTEFGFEAVGIDRRINNRHPCLLEENWFDFNFGIGKWGSVISNMSFTNHLLHAYYNGTEDLGLYLGKYKEILESLLPDGVFIYAPSVPFIEKYLCTKYEIRTAGIGKGISRTIIHRVL